MNVKEKVNIKNIYAGFNYSKNHLNPVTVTNRENKEKQSKKVH